MNPTMFRFARQGWFDDKVEARNAVVRVAQIFDARAIDRRELPWVMAGTRSMSRRRKNKLDRVGPKPFDYLRERYSASDLFGSMARIARGGAPLAERDETLWGFLERGDTEGAVRLLEEDGELGGGGARRGPCSGGEAWRRRSGLQRSGLRWAGTCRPRASAAAASSLPLTAARPHGGALWASPARGRAQRRRDDIHVSAKTALAATAGCGDLFLHASGQRSGWPRAFEASGLVRCLRMCGVGLATSRKSLVAAAEGGDTRAWSCNFEGLR